MVNAHDLLWGMTPGQLPADAPGWVLDAVSAGHPVVVRRAVVDGGWLPVGVRGPLREQRYATLMPIEAIVRRVTPQALRNVTSPRDLPALRALDQLRPLLEPLEWGVSGSAGFELASGIEALHADSDLDLIVHTPEPMSRREAGEWLALLDTALCPVDVQLQTPLGALALREWAGTAARVLLKARDGARLVRDPWQAGA
ncbi:malonate decarboxylase holo-ACP synthase [Pseudomonas mucidolens]|uniref:Phosphoribosyl-dephospho-CoA transferase n=1 Tax=Pseudomonas mucidolens TaxID=46679 RepID=A0A1H2NYE2_9PSED|nr:malonate decarboxylase holo-ACP synthase [Pseudomonas mucidolens]SDV10452.1 phosphoribosyl-dephospho-CoA transferase [Pseudomonas mucidolens]SQH37045.1 phosphoribosyl-dephospho-CoA transferase [Pseudomonas mucidolens]